MSFGHDLQAGRLVAVRQSELQPGAIAHAGGVITTMHLDQVDFAARRGEIQALLGRGGNIVFNGHVMRPFLDGLAAYRPLPSARLADLALKQLRAHPILGDLDPADMMLRRGVAGFYGRGHNPMPAGGIAVTGIGRDRLPIDWEWTVPSGGSIFSHAGNDLWSLADGDDASALAARMVSWCRGEIAMGQAA